MKLSKYPQKIYTYIFNNRKLNLLFAISIFFIIAMIAVKSNESMIYLFESDYIIDSKIELPSTEDSELVDLRIKAFERSKDRISNQGIQVFIRSLSGSDVECYYAPYVGTSGQLMSFSSDQGKFSCLSRIDNIFQIRIYGEFDGNDGFGYYVEENLHRRDNRILDRISIKYRLKAVTLNEFKERGSEEKTT